MKLRQREKLRQTGRNYDKQFRESWTRWSYGGGETNHATRLPKSIESLQKIQLRKFLRLHPRIRLFSAFFGGIFSPKRNAWRCSVWKANTLEGIKQEIQLNCYVVLSYEWRIWYCFYYLAFWYFERIAFSWSESSCIEFCSNWKVRTLFQFFQNNPWITKVV